MRKLLYLIRHPTVAAVITLQTGYALEKNFQVAKRIQISKTLSSHQHWKSYTCTCLC